MEEDRRENPQEPGDNQDKETRRRPRGLGGIVLILLLLLALFAMVSQANMDQKFSVYDFYRVLFNGDIQQLDWQDGGHKVLVTFRKDKNAAPAKMELLLGGFDGDEGRDKELIRQLLPRELDTDSYSGLDQFESEIRDGSIFVQKAIFISHTEPDADLEEFEASPHLAPLPKGNFLTALIMKGNENKYVRVVPNGDDEVSLAAVRGLFSQNKTEVHEHEIARAD